MLVRRACTGLVALGATHASYRHGREFALRFDADASTAAIWPSVVDGMLTIATVELWRNQVQQADGQWTAWFAFGFGISLSLLANIGSTAELSAFGVTMAACPPLALLLALELLNRALKRRESETCSETSTQRGGPVRAGLGESEIDEAGKTALDLVQALSLAGQEAAEQRRWAHYEKEAAAGRCSTGAELDVLRVIARIERIDPACRIFGALFVRKAGSPTRA
ncbi:DUF2637 domain-containing protein [Amycolatopsis sp. PS_44_ISF1]|uniref:DUF2637 domain-containing protein n=1 Tax=Amycolatopsis sp. PS_44_ISF1 TaxID=2974917 RepID=UPI0028DDD25E|nr:DUF2637 domain-containing protein [Amycolatopsis sp. PS_44_ISF1]MDT8912038.1 DUF2637 domain-containing protein [Amycolatopsis sp. PS_44_ISF1]